jgi:DNA-binding IscR family transcriptional regulator
LFVSEIIDAVVGTEAKSEGSDGQCSTDLLWDHLSGQIHTFLSGISLAQLLNEHAQGHPLDQSQEQVVGTAGDMTMAQMADAVTL